MTIKETKIFEQMNQSLNNKWIGYLGKAENDLNLCLYTIDREGNIFHGLFIDSFHYVNDEKTYPILINVDRCTFDKSEGFSTVLLACWKEAELKFYDGLWHINNIPSCAFVAEGSYLAIALNETDYLSLKEQETQVYGN